MNDTLAPWERELLEGEPKPVTKVASWFHITMNMAVLGLLDILDRFGQDHYASGAGGGCIYSTKTDSNALVPVCIVGQFFADLGILGALLETPNDRYNGVSGACPTNMGAFANETIDMLNARGITIDEDAQEFLRRAQQEQDSKNTWGYSVERALASAVSQGHIALPETSLIDRAKAWQEAL